MASIFSMIVDGTIPSYKIAENEKFYAFLDINPIQRGHTLVIPKREVDYLFDLEDEELAEMIIFAKKISRSIKTSIGCKKVAIMVLGMEVPHAHIHLIPINSEGDANFNAPKQKLTKEEYIDIAKQISLEVK